MGVCRYYLQGTCKYGNKCWNDHPKGGSDQGFGGAQRQLNFGGSGGGGSSVFQNALGNNQNPYKWLSNNDSQNSQKGKQQQQTGVQASAAEIVKNFQTEMVTWDQSKMWPFSCFGYEKDAPSIPEFTDYSQEELRFEAYEAQKSGNIQPYVQKIQQLISEFSAKKQEMKKPSTQLRRILTDFIENSRRKKSSNQPQSSNVFGTANSGSSSLFGSTGSNLFGNSQTNSTAPSLFGNKTSSSVFGSTQNTGSSVFGSQKPAGSSVFGSPKPAGSSVFGSKPAESSGGFGGQSSVFGNQQPSNSSVFGSAAAQKPNPFGGQQQQQQQTTGSNLFGSQTQPNTFASTQQVSPFGPAQPSTGSAGAFSQTPFGASTAQTAAFTQPQQNTGNSGIAQTVNPNPFGQNPLVNNSAVPGFSTTAPQSGVQPSPFGQPQQTVASTAPVVSPPAGQAIQTQPVSVSSPVTRKSGPTISYGTYTPLDKLTEEERQQFEAPKFTLGRIPTRPPPRELV